MDRITKALELAHHEHADLLLEQAAYEPSTKFCEPLLGRARRQNVSPALLRSNHLIVETENDVVVDAYRMLRTRVLSAMRRDGWNVLGVTSAGSQEGKSLTAANLAISMAREPDMTVLLIDADLRNPTLHRYFGLDVESGLADCLRSGFPLEDLVIVPGIERLLILPAGNAVGETTELLGSGKMAALINECKRRSDLRCVIVDLPPVLNGDDAIALTSVLDAALLVVEEGKTLASDLTKSMELLDRVRVVGTVLNRSHDTKQR